MKTIKEKKEHIFAEYYRFCKDMLYVTNNKDVIEDFAGHYIEHYIGCFGFFNNDYFVSKDLETVKKEITKILIEKYIK